MESMKVKVIVGNETKGVFNNPINLKSEKKEENIQHPILKTSILHEANTPPQYQNVNEMYNDAGIIRSKVIRSNHTTQSETVSDIQKEINNCIKPEQKTIAINTCPSDEEETDPQDRAATEEEMCVFDSIEDIPEEERTESEKAFMLLYINGDCPPLDELEKALIPIRAERTIHLQEEIAASSDIDYSNIPYVKRLPDDEETFQKIRPSRRNVLGEY